MFAVVYLKNSMTEDKKTKPRIGIYGSVAQESAIFETLTRMLGYNPYTVANVTQDTIIAPHCGRARTFGPHFTLTDIFTPTDYAELIEALKKVSSAMQPFEYVFSSFSGYVRGDYQGGNVYKSLTKTVLALDFDDAAAERFKQIHRTLINAIQPFRDGIEPEFSREIFKQVPELWALIEKYGAPYVLENFKPHVTIASKLDGKEETCDQLIRYCTDTYGKELLRTPVQFDALYIFEEILGGEFNGFFKIKTIIPIRKNYQ